MDFEIVVYIIPADETILVGSASSGLTQLMSKMVLQSRVDISPEDIVLAGKAFEEKESRGFMFRVGKDLLKKLWGDFPRMVDALTVLLITWNGAFYRYGMFDQNALETWLRDRWKAVESLRHREIVEFSNTDEAQVVDLFESLLGALQIASGKSRGKKSPVAVAKALHLLAPGFLPLWDKEIAERYGCAYAKNPSGAYIRFCRLNREIALKVSPLLPASKKPLLNRLDQFNYARFTKHWI